MTFLTRSDIRFACPTCRLPVWIEKSHRQQASVAMSPGGCRCRFVASGEVLGSFANLLY